MDNVNRQSIDLFIILSLRVRSAQLVPSGRSKLITDWYCMCIGLCRINSSSDDSTNDLLSHPERWNNDKIDNAAAITPIFTTTFSSLQIIY